MKHPARTAALFRRLATLIAALAVTLTMAFVAAPTASAGGCRAQVVCGTVVNETFSWIRVCTHWGGSGPHYRYYAGPCRATGRVQPYSVWGSPSVDIDAIYVPDGHSYYGVSYCPWSYPQRLNHKGGGWWTFPNNCVIHIRLAT